MEFGKTEAPVVYREESLGNQHFVLEIRVLQKRPINDHDKEIFWKAADMIKEALYVEDERTDPERIKAKEEWIQKARELFRETHFNLVYLEEIPNEYWNRPSEPWLLVTTQFGHFKVGWRKRVIVIDWSKTILEATAERIFPDEKVTMEGKMIHAWGYDAMKKYLIQIRNCIAVQNTR